MGKKYSVCFLFGAGAESGFGFPLGTEFITKIIKDKESPKFLSKINNYKTNAKYNFLDKRKTSVITQTADEYENGIEDFIRDFSSFGFSQNSFNFEGKKDENNSTRNAKDIYKEMCDDIKSGNKIEYWDKLIKVIKFYTQVDEEFNYLRLPEKYTDKCAKIMCYYFSVLVAIYEIQAEKIKGNTCLEKRNFLLTEIEKEEMNRLKLENKDRYYNILENCLKYKNSDVSVKIVTTNYTGIVSKILKKYLNDGEDIFHIHGKYDLFENLNTKEIDEITNFEENDIIFPFLLMPSGVKPIINLKEIKMIEKGLEALSDSDIVVILGYSLKNEDEYILNTIRKRIKLNKTTFIFEYMNSVEKTNEFKKVLNVTGKSSLSIFGTEEFKEQMDYIFKNKYF